MEHIAPHARRAAEELGVSPKVLIAQSALETGWGQHMMQRPDGSPAFNLFGIKADASWEGDKVTQSTLEFEGGVMNRRKAAFRAYDSAAESLQDYVNFIQQNPRYEQALKAADDRGYVHGLQQAGYATDPEYADKILAVLQSDRFQKMGAEGRSG